MLYKQLLKIAPDLAVFLQKVSPELAEEEIEVVNPNSIPFGFSGRGSCYLFSYRRPAGKGKPELPYYHIFPMVITLEREKKHILGLNPFYLGRGQRKTLIERLLNELMGKIENPDARTKINYPKLDKYRASFGIAFPCIKKYEIRRMSPIAIKIKPDLWEKIYLGELSRKHQEFFIGRSARSVWAKSRVIALREQKRKK